jgi:chemotaxis protein MotB
MNSTQRIIVIAAALAVAAGSLGGCGIAEEVYLRDVNALKQKLNACEQARSALQGRFDDLQTKYDDAAGARDTCQRELAAMQQRGESLDAGLRRALDRITELEKIAQRQRAVFDKLRSQLDALVKAGKLKIAIVRGQFTVQLADAILFPKGSDYLKPEGKETITEITTILAQMADRRWQIAGHTDSEGADNYNWKLSGDRALAVTKHMIRAGMPPERVSLAGYGEFAPTAPNDTEEGKTQNRRIEIVLIPDIGELLGPLLGGDKS